MHPALDLSSYEIDLSESFVPEFGTRGNKGRNISEQPDPTQKYFPKSVPKAGSDPNIFSHLSEPSQMGIGSHSGTPSPSAPKKDGTLLRPETRKPNPKPFAFNWGDAKALLGNPTDSGTVKTELTGGVFGLATGSSFGNISGKPSSLAPRGDAADTQPLSSGLSASLPSTAAGNSPLASAAAKSAFGDSSSTKPSDSLLENPKPVTSLFPEPRFGAPSGATRSHTSTGGPGLLGIAPTKNDNNLK